ncbi:DUF4262 domain-containing protein [Duganella sp. HH105]|uniref:DUF4262 domain-containing protein n=1 Tax=Duganella sp. HH105 TaxID=1781067 RepID=UPI0009003959|nr:DUF4262 domain-containing protein [Duganella sp. HH105]
MTREKIVEKIRADILEFGWHCLSVFPSEGQDGENFTYTVGLVESFSHPEIMIFGLSNKTSHGILTDCVEKVGNGKVFRSDVEYDDVIGGDYKVLFKEVRSEFLSEYFGAAARYYGSKEFSGLVMFWPDKNRRFPWDETQSDAQREGLSIV